MDKKSAFVKRIIAEDPYAGHLAKGTYTLVTPGVVETARFDHDDHAKGGGLLVESEGRT